MKIERGAFTSDKIYLTQAEIQALSKGDTILGSAMSIQPELGAREKLDKYRDSYMEKTHQTPTVVFMPKEDYVSLMFDLQEMAVIPRGSTSNQYKYHDMELRSWERDDYAIGEVME